MLEIPKYLFVVKLNSPRMRMYEFVSQSSHNKYLYKDMAIGTRETFLYQDIFNSKYHRGYECQFKNVKYVEYQKKKRREGQENEFNDR